MKKSDERPSKQRRDVCGNEYQKKMAYKKHARIKYTVFLVYRSVKTAPPSRCVFFDVLSAQY